MTWRRALSAAGGSRHSVHKFNANTNTVVNSSAFVMVSRKASFRPLALLTPVHQQNRQMGMIAEFMQQVKKGFSENKEMTEQIEKLKQETKETTDKLKEKYEKTKRVVGPSVQATAERAHAFKEHVAVTTEKIGDSKVYQGTVKVLGKTTEVLIDTVDEIGEAVKDTAAAKVAKKTGTFLKEELVDNSVLSQQKYHPYQSPSEEVKVKVLKAASGVSDVVVEENADAKGVVMHSSSRWEVEWANFKENNPAIQKAYEMKMRYDESDSIIVRMIRSVTDKFSEISEAVAGGNDIQEVLAEIRRSDPTFEKEAFIEECHSTLLPLLLEGYYKKDEELLKSWCAEHTWNIIKHIYKSQKDAGLQTFCEIKEIKYVDIFNAVMMDQGPVLNVTAMVQQLCFSVNKKGEVVDGSDSVVEEVLYVVAFCRDESLTHVGAWKVMDFSMHLRRPVV